MAKTRSGPSTIAVVGIVLLAVVSVGRMWKANQPTPPPTPKVATKPVVHNYRVDLLAQESCSEGQVLHLTDKSNRSVDFPCGPDDAAIAALDVKEVTATGVKPTVYGIGHITVQDTKDQHGNKIYTDSREFKGLYFVTIAKGFAHAPSKVSTVAEFHVMDSKIEAKSTPCPIVFTKIAPAKRVLTPPSKEKQAELEKVAIAEYLEDLKFHFIKVATPKSPDDYLIPTITAASYSSEQSAASSDELRSRSLSYANDIDCVKVRLDHYHRTYTEAVLTYRNAEIVDVKGVRYLWFPSTEDVGSMSGYSAIVPRHTLEALDALHIKKPSGDISVSLKPGKTAQRVESIKCIAVSPTVEEMGLDWLRVSIGSYGYSSLFKSTRPNSGQQLRQIPLLTMRFRIQADVKVSSEMVVLPVHRVKSDPSYRNSPKVGNGTGGPGIALGQSTSRAPMARGPSAPSGGGGRTKMPGQPGGG